jgi:hypothetical protein
MTQTTTPEGYALVPIEPTEKMIIACGTALKRLIESTPQEELDKWLRPTHYKNMVYYAPPKLKAIARYKAMIEAGRIDK